MFSTIEGMRKRNPSLLPDDAFEKLKTQFESGEINAEDFEKAISKMTTTIDF